jgi:hypothetical protein
MLGCSDPTPIGPAVASAHTCDELPGAEHGLPHNADLISEGTPRVPDGNDSTSGCGSTVLQRRILVAAAAGFGPQRVRALNRFAIVAAVARPERYPQARDRR